MARFLDTALRDLRHAVRLLARNPGFGSVVVLTLALGIGGVSAILSLVDAVLLRPLPFREPSRLVLLWEHNRPRNRDHNTVGPYNFMRWRERSQSFDGLAGFARREFNVLAEGEPERLPVGIVTGNLFDVLGVGPLVGRPFSEADSRPGAPDVVLLSEGYWRRRFGADGGVVGRRLEVNGRSRIVVGVLPGFLQMPTDVSLWLPITLSEELRNAGGRWMVGVGRLRGSVSLPQAREEMERIATGLERENPDNNAGWGVNVQPLHADLVRDLRPAVLVLLVAVGLVMLIACANVANLLLSRALAREREIALRGALGAGRGRLVGQMFSESLLAATIGGALGLLLGRGALAGIVALLPPEVPLVVAVSLDARVLALTAATVIASLLLFGLVPALQLSRPALVEALRQGATVRGAGGTRLRLKNALVVGEMALSVALLAGAGLLLRSFWSLSQLDPGYRAEGVLTAQATLTESQPQRVAAFYRQAVERLRQAPGVQAAGAISFAFPGVGSATPFRPIDRPRPAPGAEPICEVRFVTPGVFDALGIPLKQGRDFTDMDRDGTPLAVVVNESGARELWPGRNPLGQRVAMSWFTEMEAEVVGVVGDVRLTALDKPAGTTLYWAQAQVPSRFMTFAVRGSGRAETLAPVLRSTVAALDPKLPLGRIQPLAEVVQTSLASRRFLLLLTWSFAVLALLLAGIGVYGVVSYSVKRRSSEIGVRLALGAQRGDVARLVLAGAAHLSVFGVIVGLVGVAAGGRLLGGLLYGVSPWDPVAYLGVAAGALVATVVVAALPALRAARLSPALALREE